MSVSRGNGRIGRLAELPVVDLTEVDCAGTKSEMHFWTKV